MTDGHLAQQDWDKAHWGNYDANVQFLIRTGLLEVPRKILEIGCGKGALTKKLIASGHDVVGIDLDAEAISVGRVENRDLPVVIANGDSLPFAAGTFHLVLSFDVFEHIRNTDQHLREVWRVLDPDGHYLLQTPNKWTNTLFEMVRHSRKFGIKNAFLFLEDHCSLHSYWQLIRRLHKHQLIAEFYDIPVVNDFFRQKIKMFVGTIGLVALRVINPDMFPRPLRTNFYVEAQKRAVCNQRGPTSLAK